MIFNNLNYCRKKKLTDWLKQLIKFMKSTKKLKNENIKLKEELKSLK